MSCYLIVYDISAPFDAAVNEAIRKAIQDFGTWAHVTDTSWAIVTDKKTSEVRDELLQHLREQDRLLVLKSGSVGAWHNVICRNEWLKEKL